jgi:hypothetical protein
MLKITWSQDKEVRFKDLPNGAVFGVQGRIDLMLKLNAEDVIQLVPETGRAVYNVPSEMRCIEYDAELIVKRKG